MIALACFLEDSSGLAIVASHLYDFGRHYSEIKRQNVLSSIEKANQSGDELKKKNWKKPSRVLKSTKTKLLKNKLIILKLRPGVLSLLLHHIDCHPSPYNYTNNLEYPV